VIEAVASDIEPLLASFDTVLSKSSSTSAAAAAAEAAAAAAAAAGLSGWSDPAPSLAMSRPDEMEEYKPRVELLQSFHEVCGIVQLVLETLGRCYTPTPGLLSGKRCSTAAIQTGATMLLIPLFTRS
jgi:hypothetical protein